MKNLILISSLCFILVSCDQPKAGNAAASKGAQDTTGTAPNVPEQKKPVSEHSASELAPYFNEQVSGAQILVQAKGISRKTDGLYCYFRLKGKKATALRFHIQYWDEKYADVDSYTFNADGKKFNYIANRNESGSANSQIAQSSYFYWYDNGVNKTDLAFLEAVANGKNVILSLIDRGTNEAIGTLSLSEEEKLNIRRTIDYYYALDGAIIPRKGMVNIRQ
ncbi:hypothetical protein [Viscerimonas tarda]